MVFFFPSRHFFFGPAWVPREFCPRWLGPVFALAVLAIRRGGRYASLTGFKLVGLDDPWNRCHFLWHFHVLSARHHSYVAGAAVRRLRAAGSNLQHCRCNQG